MSIGYIHNIAETVSAEIKNIKKSFHNKRVILIRIVNRIYIDDIAETVSAEIKNIQSLFTTRS